MKETNQNNSDYSFIEEKIKERPLNRKKLIRKMLLTAGAALVFGIVACVTFLCLEPLVSKIITPKEENELQQVVITEQEAEEPEILPEIAIEETPLEEMTLDDDMTGTAGQNVKEDSPSGENGAEEAAGQQIKQLELEDYQLLHRKMYALAEEVRKSLVTVTGMASDTDWLSITDQSSGQTIGMIISDNGKDLMILADSRRLEGADSLMVTFCDGSEVEAVCQQTDQATGLGVYAVRLSSIPVATREIYKEASVASSNSSAVMGGAILAVGYPTGASDSVCYGAVTSNRMSISLPDADYQILTTDIYGSRNASGVIANLKGQVIGFITNDYHEDGMENLIYAYGFSSIRRLIENLSNDVSQPYLGLYLTDVTTQATETYDIPQGVYITKVELNSPALLVGISTGDVLVGINDKKIGNVNDYMTALTEVEPEQYVTLTLMRFNGEEYMPYETEVRAEAR